jgi:hypothetical protein
MSKVLEVVKINNKQYYKADDVYTRNPGYFCGCDNNPRNIIDKKQLAQDYYLYAYVKDSKWILSKKEYRRAKLLLEKSWVDNNIKGVDETKNIVNDIEMAPPIIVLDDDEYFTDKEGNKLNITIRGNRSKREFFFCVKDVAKAFELPSLYKTVIDNRKDGYEKNVHYKYFYLGKNVSGETKADKNNKFLCLTYNGLMRSLYCNRSKNADKFQAWANDILFIHQFGSEKDKTLTASKLLGVHANAVKQVFKTSATSVPCVYLFTLGTVKDLRESMKLNAQYTDNMIICKYGKTDNLERRTQEHITVYGSIKGSNLMLKYYSYIDPIHITSAENNIKDHMNIINAHIIFENHKELVVLEPKVLNDKISEQYDMVAKAFAGCISDLQNKIKHLENELIIMDLKNKLIIQEKEKQLEDMKNKYEIELLKKELEIAKQSKCAKKTKK